MALDVVYDYVENHLMLSMVLVQVLIPNIRKKIKLGEKVWEESLKMILETYFEGINPISQMLIVLLFRCKKFFQRLCMTPPLRLKILLKT